MNEKTKFHKLTKPIRFRGFKITFQSVSDTMSSVIYKTLYRLNILHRHSYKDSIESLVYSFRNIPGEVSNSFLRASIKSNVMKTARIDEEWYYFKDKNKPVKVISDLHEEEYRIVSSLDDISIKIGDKCYPVAKGLPTFSTMYKDPVIPANFTHDYVLKRPQWKKIVIDIKKLRNIQSVYHFNIESFDGDYKKLEPMFNSQIWREFNDYLGSFTLPDFFI